jgi:hypothetical protein
MKNYIYDIFYDLLLSVITKKYGTTINDDQREDKAYEIIGELRAENKFTVDMTQALIDKKGFNASYSENVNGQSVYALVKEGMFKKIKCCYFITRNKNEINGAYLEQIYEELRRQANGENIFNAKEYKNG